MCGFFAVLHNEPTFGLQLARRGLHALAHRGPDANGEWYEEGVFLGHCRLSIIDLTTGGQPMQSHDGRYVIIFNGEIYNFPELRGLLQRDGAVFRTKSDTEVILEGYRRWGTKVVEKLNGMFAFLIWDRVRSYAFGARDRLGIKPLCWATYKGALIVSSTLEPFGTLGEFSRLDLIAVRDLMAFDYIPAPRSILKQVHKLDPGTTLEWHIGAAEPTLRRYWSPPFADPGLPIPDKSELEELLDRVIQHQMISDVPIGVFLSGGIDSSLITAIMARHTSRVSTFSVAFSEGNVDESPVAQLVAEHFGTDHTVLHAEELDSCSLLDLLGRLDEPFCDAAFVPTFALSTLTKCHVKVALSGDGGDEVFGGYPKYLQSPADREALPFASVLHRTLQAVPWRPRGLSHFYRRILSPRDKMRFSSSCYGDFPVFRKDIRQLLTSSYHGAAEVDDFFEPWERKARRYGDGFGADVVMRTDLETYLSENCLVKTDRASMLASLEVRVPLLDNILLDRILPLTAEKKVQDGQLKALLLPIARGILPRQVWDRPKHGFNVPLDLRLARAWKPAVDAVLEWGKTNVDMFNYSYLRQLHAINLREGGVSQELWSPFVLLAWLMARDHNGAASRALIAE